MKNRVLAGLILMWLSLCHSSLVYASSDSCSDLLRAQTQVLIESIELNIETKGLEEHEIREVTEDLALAVRVGHRIFPLTGPIVIQVDRKDNEPQFEQVSKKITAAYTLGPDGSELPWSQTRVAAYHEFGHLVFEQHVSPLKLWLLRVQQAGVLYQGKGLSAPLIYRAMSELFADTFAVMLSQDPQALSNLSKIKNIQKELAEHFALRDFSRPIEVEGWTIEEEHLLLSPVRSFLGRNSQTSRMIKQDPDGFIKLVFQAISAEMKSIAGYEEELEYHFLTVEDLNTRLIQRLEKLLKAN